MLIFLTVFFIIMISVVIFLLIRIEWAYKKRIKWIHKDVDAYERGPSFGYMFWTFWIWDDERYFNPEKRK